MKYKFVKRIKEVSTEEIHNTMDFEKALEQATLNRASYHKQASASNAKWGFAIVLLVTLGAWFFFTNEEKNEVPYEEPNIQEEVVAPLKPEPDTLKQPAEPEPKPSDIGAVKEEKVVEPQQAEEEKPSSKPAKEEPKTTVVYEDVINPAKPIPGEEAFNNFINKELVYPESELDGNVEGYVRVFFKVNKKGIAEDFKIRKSLGDAFDQEAIRVLQLFQQWEPGSYNGEAVDSYLNIKVNFSLTEKNND
ncbi:TonB family protein [Roseivirga pacifica]|uniref:energy transducer TonB n=1 Tax=Roseivirga pacifica TaxID=1267423 RepID=UPI003BB016FB